MRSTYSLRSRLEFLTKLPYADFKKVTKDFNETYEEFKALTGRKRPRRTGEETT